MGRGLLWFPLLQLHADFEFEACKTRARVRRGVTVPEEFNLSGTNRKENAARRLRVLEGKVREPWPPPLLLLLLLLLPSPQPPPPGHSPL